MSQSSFCYRTQHINVQFVYIAPEGDCVLSKKPSDCFKSWSSPSRHRKLSAADDEDDNDEMNTKTSDEFVIEFGIFNESGSLLYYQNTIRSYGQ